MIAVVAAGVAQNVASRHSDRVARLVLTNAVCYDSWPIPSVKVMRTLGPLVQLLPNAVFRLIYTLLIHQKHDNRQRARESVAEHGPYYDRTDGAAAFIRQARSLNDPDTLDVAGNLPCLEVPPRIVWGAADPTLHIKYAKRLARDLDAIEGGHNFVPEDHPDRVAKAVQALLEYRPVKESA